jgi:hypothetical protein
LAAVPAAGLVLLLAGCGGTTAAASSAPDNSNNAAGNSNAAGGNNNSQGRAFPGAQGKIADISGKTLQVQNDTTQTAVTYTSATKMSQTVSGSKSDLAVGKCVSVRPVQSGTDPSAAPTQTDDSTPIEAGSVTISDPTNGSCNGGFGGAGFGGSGARGNGGFRGQRGANGGTQNGGAPTGDAGQAPTGAQGQGNGQGRGQGQRGGGFGGGGFGGGGANGTITAINGDTVTVEMQRPQFNQGANSGTGASGTAASSTPTMTTVTRTVTLSSATTYTKTESASSSDLKVGKCVTALGSTDSNGTLAATSIALRPADASGSCTAGMFGGFGGRRGAGANGTANTGTVSS